MYPRETRREKRTLPKLRKSTVSTNGTPIYSARRPIPDHRGSDVRLFLPRLVRERKSMECRLADGQMLESGEADVFRQG